MADTEKLPAKTEAKSPEVWHPFRSLREEIDRLFDDFGRDAWQFPFRRDLSVITTPAVDVVEKDDAFEITAELPGMSDKDVEVTHANGRLTIKGEKKEEKEEKKKDYYLSERRYGSFQRSFAMPDGVNEDKIDARFKDGVLTVTLPKTPAAKKATKKIAVKAG